MFKLELKSVYFPDFPKMVDGSKWIQIHIVL